MTISTSTTPPVQNAIAAIDILLEPDATMIQHAQADNARLLQNFPKGYSLGGHHAPHISMLQRYVYTADLDKTFAAAATAFATENPTSWKLKAFKYYYIPAGPIGLGGIVIEPTPDLLRLQQGLIDAVTPFTAPTGTASAYVTTPQDPNSSRSLLNMSGCLFPTTAALTIAHVSPSASAPSNS